MNGVKILLILTAFCLIFAFCGKKTPEDSLKSNAKDLRELLLKLKNSSVPNAIIEEVLGSPPDCRRSAKQGSAFERVLPNAAKGTCGYDLYGRHCATPPPTEPPETFVIGNCLACRRHFGDPGTTICKILPSCGMGEN